MQTDNPFQGMHPKQIYAGLLAGDFGPIWPEERFQKGYAGTCGPALVRRAFKFIDILDEDGAFKKNWKGLDYGCGWGRFASTMMSKGSTDQLDLCDAFDHTLKLIDRLNYKNKIFKIPELLSAGDLPENKYDFAFAFSIFTHLSPESFERNIPVLLSSLKKGGTLYITVRHEDFFEHRYQEHAEEYTKELKKKGIMFFEGAAARKNFGRTAISRDYLDQFGSVRFLGLPHPLQHVYAISN